LEATLRAGRRQSMVERESRALVEVQVALEGWRRAHGGRGVRIPEEVWERAVEVARGEGLSRTARALGVDAERLRARMGVTAGRDEDRDGRARAAFVEVGVGGLGGTRTVVELVGRKGEQMRIDVVGPGAVDVVGLARAFWSGRS
jgi:hypothetical protein